MKVWSGIGIGVSAAAMTATMSATAAQAQERAISYNIPPQDLGSALKAFAQTSQRQVTFDSRAVRGKRSPGVSGTHSVDQAINLLLGGSGMKVERGQSGVFIVRPSTGSVVVLTGTTPPSQPVQSVAVEDETGEPTASGDIVVTAQRRAERQQDVPVSLTAFNANTITNFRLNRLEDVSRLTPSLLVSSFSPGRPVIAVRGATNTFNQIGVDKPVGVFVDDVYIARNSAATLELFGIESIQVLRGPQGTLFGRNVTGGAIVIDSGRPSFEEPRLAMRASGASYDTFEFDALANVPVSETAAVRLGGLVRRHAGWGRDGLNGQELDDQESYALRGQIRFQLGEGAEVLIGGDYSDDKSGGRTLSSIGAGDDGDRRTAETGVPQRFARVQGGVSGRIVVETPIGDLTSITAYRQSRSTDIFSNVGANFRFLTGTQSQALSDDRDDVETVSQELRLVSPQWSFGSFILGGYYSNEDSARQLRSTALAAVTGALVTNQLADQTTVARSFAIFADGTLNILPILSVSAGGRYTWDRKRAGLARTDFRVPANGFSDTDLEINYSQFTPRAVVKLQPNRDLMFYASYSRGYTAGGYNTEAATLAALRTPFRPEIVDNYEAGAKTEFLDRRLRVNLTGFQMKYKDKQELFFNNVTRVLNINNAAKATIRGLETDVEYRPSDWLTLTGSYGLLATRYDDFVIPGGANNTGNRLGSSPHDKVSAAIDLRIPVGTGHVTGNAAYSYTSGYFTGAARDFTLFIPSYDLVNAAIGYAGEGDRFTASIVVRNLFDKEYILIPSNQVVRSQYLGAPRIIGATLSARF